MKGIPVVLLLLIGLVIVSQAWQDCSPDTSPEEPSPDTSSEECSPDTSPEDLSAGVEVGGQDDELDDWLEDLRHFIEVSKKYRKMTALMTFSNMICDPQLDDWLDDLRGFIEDSKKYKQATALKTFSCLICDPKLDDWLDEGCGFIEDFKKYLKCTDLVDEWELLRGFNGGTNYDQENRSDNEEETVPQSMHSEEASSSTIQYTSAKIRPFDLLRTTHNIPSYLIDVALGYFRKNVNNSMDLPPPSFWPLISNCSIDGLHTIQREGQASLLLDERSATLNISLILHLQVNCPLQIQMVLCGYEFFSLRASLIVSLQPYPCPERPRPIFKVHEFNLSHLPSTNNDEDSETFMDIIKTSVKKLFLNYVDELIMTKTKNAIYELMNKLLTSIQN